MQDHDSELQRLTSEIASLRAENQRQQLLIDSLKRRNDDLLRQRAAIHRSATWKAMAPFRRLGTLTERYRIQLRATMTPDLVSGPAQLSQQPGILIVDATLPVPDRDSGSLDVWYQIRLFQSMGFQVAFLPMEQRAGYEQYTDRLNQIGVHYLSPSPEMPPERLLSKVPGQFDHIQFNRIDTAKRFLWLVRKCAFRSKIIFNTVDLHFLREEREQAHGGSRDGARSKAQRRRDELACINAADATIVLSDVEGKLLASIAPRARVFVIPFARSVGGRPRPFAGRQGALFVGGFLHSPNVDAVKWLAADIWPKVRQLLPDAELQIVGSNPLPEMLQLHDANAGINLRGFVADIDEVLSRVRLTVAPLRFGAGIKGKVAMSLAAGVPCVVTPVAAEGMGLTDGKDVLIASDANGLAQAIVRAYQDETVWTALSAGGQDIIKSRYSLQCVGEHYLNLARALAVRIPDGAAAAVKGLDPGAWAYQPH